MSRSRNRIASALALLVAVAPAAARAHVGSVPSTARPTSPTGPCDLADATYDIHWTDYDGTMGLVPSQISWFYTQASPPTYLPGSIPVGIDGVQIHDPTGKLADRIDERDPANEFLWDTSKLPAGAYWEYSIAYDTPFNMYTFAQGPVVVAHAGETAWPTVVITDPDGIRDVADQSFLLAYDTCDPLGTGKVKIEATIQGNGMDLIPVADDLPSGKNTFSWDTSALAEGKWTIKATITDDQNRSFFSFPQYYLVVAHPGSGGSGGSGGEGGSGGSAGTGGSSAGGSGGEGGSSAPSHPNTGCQSGCSAALILVPLFGRRR